MDNMLKLIIAVLSLSGLLVMAVPNGDPLANQQPPAPTPANGHLPPPPPPNGGIIEEGPIDENGEVISEGEEEEEFIKFGEPMMDGLPIDPSSRSDFGRSEQQPHNQGEIIPPTFPVPGATPAKDGELPTITSSPPVEPAPPPPDGNY